jgi:hypothetical protein
MKADISTFMDVSMMDETMRMSSFKKKRDPSEVPAFGGSENGAINSAGDSSGMLLGDIY